MRPHRRQPTRLPCPWDSPGKNTAVSCHFLIQCMKVKSESEVSQSCPTPSDPMDSSLPGSSVQGIFQARVLEWGAIAFSENVLSACLMPGTSQALYLFDPMCVCLVAQLSPALCDPHGQQPARLLCPWNSPSRSTGVGGHFLLREIFPTQGSIPSLRHCRWILYG